MKLKKQLLWKLLVCLVLSLALLAGGYGLLQEVQATISAPDYEIILDSADAPLSGRPAPYGQLIVTHNGLSITTTEQLGTVARTNGYAPLKAIMCDAGAYAVTANLYARTTNDGGVYTITTGLSFPANTNTMITMTEISPWMSLGLTSEVTGSTTTCGIYVQTP